MDIEHLFTIKRKRTGAEKNGDIVRLVLFSPHTNDIYNSNKRQWCGLFFFVGCFSFAICVFRGSAFSIAFGMDLHICCVATRSEQ